ARMAATQNPLTASDAAVAMFADGFYEYNSMQEVITATVQGAGCTCGTGNGQGMYTFTYGGSNNGDDYNIWKYKTVETLPDRVSTHTVYSNYAGEVMLD